MYSFFFCTRTNTYLLFSAKWPMIFASCLSNRARRIQRYRGGNCPTTGADEAVIAPVDEFFFCKGGFGGLWKLSPDELDRLENLIEIKRI